MKKHLFTISILSLLAFNAFAVKHTVTTSGFSFSPSSLTIHPGDTVVFSFSNSHNAIEVTHETYNANQSTSNGGFNLPLGGGSVSFPNTGTYYYVCGPHVAEFGMKGIINVVTTTAINDVLPDTELKIFPNPATENITVNYLLKNKSYVELSLVTITGAEVMKTMKEAQNEGTYSFNFDFSEIIQPGIYFIKISTSEGILTRRIMVE
jgi:plastocyanin